MTMLEKAIAHMRQGEVGRVWTRNEVRIAAGVALRSQYRLFEQLKYDPRVDYESGCFRLAAGDFESRVRQFREDNADGHY